MFATCNWFRILFRPLLVVFFSCISPLTLADEKEENILNPVVVTATKTVQTADETLASVTVITRKDIDRSQSQDVFGLLRTIAGIDVARNGGSGNSTSVFMRGTNSNHVLVLIDGIRASSATTGTFSFNTLDVSQIERIEVVRGPKASLYGSDAIGGVIQIFTRKSSGTSARIEVGSFSTKKLEFNYGGGKKLKYNLNLSIKNIDGYSSTNQSIDIGVTNPSSLRFNFDKDNFKSESFSFGIKYPASDKLTLNLNSWYNNSEVEFDDGPTIDGKTDNTNNTINLSADYINSNSLTQRLSLGYATDEAQSDDKFPSNITTGHKSIDWQTDIVLESSQLITAGLNYYEDQAENINRSLSTITFDEKINNKALYVNWQGNLSKNKFLLGVRVDDHSTFGTETTSQLTWGMKFDLVQLRAAYGTAYKAPTMNELFFPFFGNPALKAETSISYEIGALHTFSKTQKMDVSIFQTEIDNLIEFDISTSLANNINKAKIRGLEIAYTINNTLWIFQTNITIQKATDESKNSPLLRRANQKLSLNISRNIMSTGNISTEMLFSSNRTDFGDTILPGYGILNLSANFPINKKIILQGRIDNVTDKQYELASGYNTADRSAYIALRYQM